MYKIVYEQKREREKAREKKKHWLFVSLLLQRVLPDSEDPLESAELAEETPLMQLHAVTVQEVQRCIFKFFLF